MKEANIAFMKHLVGGLAPTLFSNEERIKEKSKRCKSVFNVNRDKFK